jgi:transposase
LADEFGALYADISFAHLFSALGPAALAPWRLTLVTVLQFAEGLADRQAADAVRARLDWKYLLRLEPTDPGFDHTVLSEFRSRLLAGEVDELLLTPLLMRCRELGLLKARGRQRTDSTHVFAAIRSLNRLECVGETLRAALNQLAELAPTWLQAQVPVEWFSRYGTRMDNYHFPAEDAARQALGTVMGNDGYQLLTAVYHHAAPVWLRHLPTVGVLRAVWVQQYYAPDAAGQVKWRTASDLPPAAILIHSPYDVEARWSTKRSVSWVGYKAHLTETCDDDLPHLIVHVETTPATTPDFGVVPTVHADLQAADLLPAAHYLDTGYVDAENLINSQENYGVRLVGPVHEDPSWQTKEAAGFDISHFTVEWEQQQVICPQGQRSTKWQEGEDASGQAAIRIRFARAACLNCAARAQCTKAKSEPRELTLRKQAEHIALQEGRQRQRTAEFKAEYGCRAGIEGTIAQGVRRGDLRSARYMGQARTHLQHVLMAVALNLVRLSNWFATIPLARTRHSHFAGLQMALG